MVQPISKHSIEERTTYLKDPARLEKEASLAEQKSEAAELRGNFLVQRDKEEVQQQ